MIDFPVFWRTEPLNEAERNLVIEVMKAHRASVFRQNASTVNVINGAVGSFDYTKGIAAGLMAIGGIHAPLISTMALLDSGTPLEHVADAVAKKRRVPGWGNSFIKGNPDPLWSSVETSIRFALDEMANLIEQITGKLHSIGKKLYPNPSAFTAATALILGIPPHLSPMLFVTGRLSGWNELIYQKLGRSSVIWVL